MNLEWNINVAPLGARCDRFREVIEVRRIHNSLYEDPKSSEIDSRPHFWLLNYDVIGQRDKVNLDID